MLFTYLEIRFLFNSVKISYFRSENAKTANMKKTITKTVSVLSNYGLLLLILLCFSLQSVGQNLLQPVGRTNASTTKSATTLWRFIDASKIRVTTGKRYIVPTKYKTAKLNLSELESVIGSYSPATVGTIKSNVALPMPDGSLERFEIVETPIMAKELQGLFPNIRTFSGKSISDPGKTVKMDYTPKGFHAMIMVAGASTIFIDPYTFGGDDIERYIIYKRKNFKSAIDKTFQCGVVENASNVLDTDQPLNSSVFGNCDLRTYRLALAATGEYTAFHGGTVAAAAAAQVTTMNRVNGVFERDFGIRMVIVAGNNALIYTNSGSDPYSNNSGGAMLGQNQTNVNSVIGSANYDIGHVFSTGGGGVAILQSPCNFSTKAQGVTGSFAPVGDPFDIDYVAHEIGHQFGANHTFHSTSGSCGGGNRNLSTAFEPGSGSTILSYAGICNPHNVQNNSDDHFHGISLEQVSTFITNGSTGGSCPTITALSNNSPSVTGTNANVTIPRSTPFELTATATDADGNTLTYCWEQMDSDNSTQPPVASATGGPNFRSYSPVTSPTRYFPNLTDILANTTSTWEVLPSVTRTMNFRVSVRDNSSGGGCTDHNDVTVGVDGSAGPFLVNNPSNTGITWTGNTSETVTWDVAGTSASPISCSNVDILLSTDGGLTFSTLVSNTPNDGSQSITVPNTGTTTARVKVVCSDNIFFDVSNSNFTIVAVVNDYILNPTSTSVSTCQPTSAVYTVNVGVIGSYSDPVTLSTSGLPAGASATFATNPVTPGNGTTLTIGNIAGVALGAHNFTLTGNSTSGTKNETLTLNVNASASAVTLTSPINSATNVFTPASFVWSDGGTTGETYEIDIASDAGFASIVDNASGLTTTSYSSSSLALNTTYYWRVRATNGCGTTANSSTFSFTTSGVLVVACDTIGNYNPATDTPQLYTAGTGPVTFVAGHNQYGDLAKMDYFDYSGTNTHISGTYIGIGFATASNATNTFDVNIWDGTGGTPGAILSTTTVTYDAAVTMIAGGSNVMFVPLDYTSVPASNEFFVGISFVYTAGDTVALITNTNGESTPGTAWEQWNDLSYHTYDDAAGWAFDMAHYIFPVLGTPPVASYSVGSTLCEGSPVSFTSTSVGASAFEWNFATGTPNNANTSSASSTFASAGAHNVELIATQSCVSDTVSSSVDVGGPTTGTDVITTCTAHTWIDGITYSSSNNTATHLLTNASGCDSTVTLNLTIGVITGTDVVVACNSHTWINGVTYTVNNNTATHILTGAGIGGCDSTVTLDLTIISAVPSAPTLVSPTDLSTQGVPATFTWNSVGAGVTYVIEIATDAGFASIVETSSGIGTTSYTSTSLSALQPQYFWRVYAVNECGSSAASSTFSFNTISISTNDCDTIGNYDPATDTPQLYTAGIGPVTFVAGQNQYGDIAKMDYFDYSGMNTHVSGTYIGFGFATASNTTNTFNVTIWDGTGGTPGAILNTTTVTYDAIETMIAGGSNVMFVPFSYTSIPASNEFFVGVEFVYTAGDTLALITNTDGETTPATAWEQWGDLTYHPYDDGTSWGFDMAHYIFPVLGIPPVAGFNAGSMLCQGTPVSFTNTSTDASTFEWNFATGTPSTQSTLNASASFASTGSHNVQLIATQSCMTDTLNGSVIIGSPTTGTDVVSACGSYMWIDGNTYSSNNNAATHVLTNGSGCDSTVTLNLTIKAPTTGTDVISACGSYTWIDGNTYSSNNNTATHVLMNAAGCDSTVTLDLTIKTPTTGTDVVSACGPYMWIDGNTYSSNNNTAMHILMNAAGCDSTVTLNLTINSPTSSTDVIGTCAASYTWIDGMTYSSNNNSATHIVMNAAGCDSTITLDLTFNSATTGTDVVVTCGTFTWIDGITYSADNNTATHMLMNSAGCDSTVTLDLTIAATATGTDVISACGPYTWIDGNTYSSSNNTAKDTLMAAGGCDSIVTLNLTINVPTTGTDVITTCGSHTWIDGNTYSSSNTTATHVITNAAGCDSTVTLNLTINLPTSSTDVVSACGPYTWIDGNTYSFNNNVATHVVMNAAGCDSTITLDLTINAPTSGTDVVATCGTSYMWIDGNTYSSNNNSATHVIMNAAGCDSTITLDLTINTPTSSTDIISACGSYVWIDGNTYSSNNTTATHVIMNAAGCDSTITLDLTINAPTSSTDVITSCGAYTWIDGNTYSSDNNTATHVVMNAAGCDSTITLDFTISSAGSTSSTDVIASCGPYTWIDGNTYSSNNTTATHTIMNTAGCDSVITLDLTIGSVDTSVVQSGASLTASDSGSTYQWLDCDNSMSVIAGETNQVFAPTTDGNYAVELTNGNCIDTSACYTISIIGIEEIGNRVIGIYPNPSNGTFTIDLANVSQTTLIKIYNVLGEEIHSVKTSTRATNIELTVDSGIYFVVVNGKANRIVIED